MTGGCGVPAVVKLEGGRTPTCPSALSLEAAGEVYVRGAARAARHGGRYGEDAKVSTICRNLSCHLYDLSVLGRAPGFPIGWRPCVWMASVSYTNYIADVGDDQSIPFLTPDTSLVTRYIPDPLPAPLFQGPTCRLSGDLVVTFADGFSLTYGPCKRPLSINRLWAGMVYVLADGACAPKCGPGGLPGPWRASHHRPRSLRSGLQSRFAVANRRHGRLPGHDSHEACSSRHVAQFDPLSPDVALAATRRAGPPGCGVAPPDPLRPHPTNKKTAPAASARDSWHRRVMRACPLASLSRGRQPGAFHPGRPEARSASPPTDNQETGQADHEDHEDHGQDEAGNNEPLGSDTHGSTFPARISRRPYNGCVRAAPRPHQ